MPFDMLIIIQKSLRKCLASCPCHPSYYLWMNWSFSNLFLESVEASEIWTPSKEFQYKFQDRGQSQINVSSCFLVDMRKSSPSSPWPQPYTWKRKERVTATLGSSLHTFCCSLYNLLKIKMPSMRVISKMQHHHPGVWVHSEKSTHTHTQSSFSQQAIWLVSLEDRGTGGTPLLFPRAFASMDS